MSGYKRGADRNQIMLNSLDDMVGAESMARVIDRLVDIADLRRLGFAKTAPAALCKLYVYGYENGVRSSRKLERETLRNVEVMWLLNNLTPDYKTIAEFRRENVRPLQKLFREFVRMCKSWELIAVDGTKIKASNNKKSNFSRKKIEARLAHIDEKIDEYLAEMDAEDGAEMQSLQGRKEQYESYKKQLDDAGANELSVVDPDARLMGNNRGGVDVAYNVQSAADGKHDIIIEYDVSMNPSDQHQLGNMVKKVIRKLKLKRFTALADKGYYNGEDLLRLKRLKVTAVVSKQKPSDAKGRAAEYRSDKFAYHPETDSYTCPAGNSLTSPNKKSAKRRNFRNKAACEGCAHREHCAAGTCGFRTVTRSQFSGIYDEADRRFEASKELYKRRQQIVEHPFGTVKRFMDGGNFLLRTRRKVCAEVALLFLGYNLKRAVKVLGFEGIMARLNSLVCAILRILQRTTRKSFDLRILLPTPA